MGALRKFAAAAAVMFLLAPASRAGEENYGDYPAPDEMFREIYSLREKYPDWVEVGEFGRSVQDRPLLDLRISRPGAEAPAPALVAANIHGNEWIGNRVAMAAARMLLEGRESDPWISSMLDNIEFYFLPCINPDGYQKTWDSRNDDHVPWAKMRKNANGVDINRNFPLPAPRTVDDPLAGSDDPDHPRYTGPEPYSEPESRAVRDFVASKSFFASIDLHSNWGTFFPPKCNGRACEKQFKKMMDTAAAKQEIKYVTVQQWQVDSFSGEMEDAMFYDYGIMAVCWEIFPEAQASEQGKRLKHPFWSMNPEDIDFWTANDSGAVLAALEKAYEITGGKPVPEKYRKVDM